MSDAYECDRCGEMDSKPPAMRVAADTPEVGGKIRASVKERDLTGATQGLGVGGSSRNPATAGFQAATKIVHGDLCENCATELRGYWVGGDSDE